MYFRTLFSPQSIVVMYITRNSRHIGLRPKRDYKIGTYLSIYLSTLRCLHGMETFQSPRGPLFGLKVLSSTVIWNCL